MISTWNLSTYQDFSLADLQELYCLWDYSQTLPYYPGKLFCSCESSKVNLEASISDDKSFSNKVVKRRARRSRSFDITSSINALLYKIRCGELSDRDFQNKAVSKSRNLSLRRSSKFIGVSQNGDNWQAMINSGRGKQYIGTYASELEAGIAYDFYSFAVHQCSRKTNFSYDATIFETIAKSYFQNGKILNTSEFMHLVK